MFYYLYEIKNNVNGKVYIGVHKTNTLADEYMGSGKRLKQAFEKYGIENFSKTILEVFHTESEMYEREKQIVNEEFVARKDTYNMKIGGSGGFDHINNDVEFRIEKNKNAKRIADKMWEYKYGPEFRSIFGKKGAAQRNARYPNLSLETAQRGHEEGWFSFKGKSHSDKAKNLIGQKNSIHQKGNKNSQYGTMWITNGVLNQKISSNEQIPLGFRKGRVLKKS